MSKPAKKQKKYIIVDFSAGEVVNRTDLEEVKTLIQIRTDNEGQNADWAVNNFVVYEIKEQIIFTAKEEINIQFGIG